MEKGEGHSWNLDACPTESKQQTVCLGYTVETPGIIRHTRGKTTNLLHPMAAPRPWIEIGNHPKGTTGNLFKSIPHGAARHEFRNLCVRVKPEIDLLQ